MRLPEAVEAGVVCTSVPEDQECAGGRRACVPSLRYPRIYRYYPRPVRASDPRAWGQGSI
jgi:hypothetical protein